MIKVGRQAEGITKICEGGMESSNKIKESGTQRDVRESVGEKYIRHKNTKNRMRKVVGVATRPLTRVGGMAEDHGASEARQLPRAWTRGSRDRESPKSERRKEYVAGQCRRK